MTLKQFQKALKDRKHVDGLPFGHRNASFVANMSFGYVMAILPHLKVYKPKK